MNPSINPYRIGLVSIVAVLASLVIVAPVSADPLPGQVLKFQQLPLNNGVLPTYPSPTDGGAPYPGHDELSTANLLPDGQVYRGTYMADDFADRFDSPVVHVRWWGSYLENEPLGGVRQFLISFEHDVPADPANGIPSHPDFNHPGNLHQIVTLSPGGGTPPGTFTEKLVPTPTVPGGVDPQESLYEYNAELHLDKWFRQEPDTVYWLKIVALVDPQEDGPIQWGWHSRDWSISDPLASTQPAVVPGESVVGSITDFTGVDRPIWHFQDDAVSGIVDVAINPDMPFMPQVVQDNFDPQRYVAPWDGPEGIVQYSKDLAFELYTVPEPGAWALWTLGGLALAVLYRTRR